MFKQKHFLALGAVTLAALLLLSLPARVTARLKLAVGSLFMPLSSLAATAEQLPADVADNVLPRRELLQEIGRLQRENQELKVQALQNTTIGLENEQLRNQLRWQHTVPWKIKLANVVMRDVSSPAPGSVTPKHTCTSPVATGGNVRALSSSEPCTTTGCMPKIDRWIALAPFMAAPDLATSSSNIVASVIPRPWPPYSTGIVMPSQPPSAIAR